MLLYTIIVMKLVIGSILLGTGMAKPLENEDFRQYQNSGGNPYTLPVLSAATFGASQSGFSPIGNTGVYRPQSIPPFSFNLFGSNPFGAQSSGASTYGSPGSFPSAGMPGFFG